MDEYSTLAPTAALATFGEALCYYRQLAGLSLRLLARRTGCSHVHLHNLERGAMQPSVKLAGRCDQELDARGVLLALARADTGHRLVEISGRAYAAAQEYARRENRPISEVVSTIILESLAAAESTSGAEWSR